MSNEHPNSRITEQIKRWVRPQIQAMDAYYVQESEGLIKLDAMENPYTWPEGMRSQWLERLGKLEINRYPDPQANELKRRLKEDLTLPGDLDLMLGNGSDELIQILCMAVAGEGRSVLIPEPSFEMYGLIARVCGFRCIGVPLAEETFALDRDSMLKAISDEQPALIFLATPNNPTGTRFDTEVIRELAVNSDALIVLDEAYCRFAGGSVMQQLADIENLFFMQSMSKFGLAGLRLGMLAAHKRWLDELEKVRLPYNINALSQISAVFAFEHSEVLDAHTARICAERSRLLESLGTLDGVQAWQSYANFVMMRVLPGGQGAFEHLKEAGVLVKNLHNKHPRLHDCLRVTVGTAQENDAFLAGLESYLSQAQ